MSRPLAASLRKTTRPPSRQLQRACGTARRGVSASGASRKKSKRGHGPVLLGEFSSLIRLLFEGRPRECYENGPF